LWIIRLIALRIVHRNVNEAGTQYKWRKNLTYIVGFIGVFWVGSIWFKGFESVTTFLGLWTAGLAITLGNPISAFEGLIFLMWRRPFYIGDRIQIGDIKGDVIDLRIFKFTVLEIGNWVHADQSTGRVIHVPNHTIFNDSIANYTRDFQFIWNEIPVMVTFESNWEKAKKILQDVAENHQQEIQEKAENQIRRAAKSYLIYYRNLTPIVYTDVADSGVTLTIRHLTDPRRRRSSQQGILEEVLQAFSEEPDIDLAYPTIRYYDNRSEGKNSGSTDAPTSG
jgi:small-conductance mechanosensitive channel